MAQEYCLGIPLYPAHAPLLDNPCPTVPFRIQLHPKPHSERNFPIACMVTMHLTVFCCRQFHNLPIETISNKKYHTKIIIWIFWKKKKFCKSSQNGVIGQTQKVVKLKKVNEPDGAIWRSKEHTVSEQYLNSTIDCYGSERDRTPLLNTNDDFINCVHHQLSVL